MLEAHGSNESRPTESQRLRSIFANPHSPKRPALVEITDDNFVTEVLDAKGLVVFDFWADYCVRCKLMHEVILRLAETYTSGVKFGRIDSSKNHEIVQAFGLKAIPHLVATINGDIVLEIVGDRSFDELKSRLDPFVSTASGGGAAPREQLGGDETGC